MTLIKIIVALIEDNIDRKNDWYKWREINESKIPYGIKLSKGSQFNRNIELKSKLHSKWKCSNQKEKGFLIEYYIKNWGGISRNNKETMKKYKTQSHEALIQNGYYGIASWSKALVIHSPKKYAIFDARVSLTINALQTIHSLKNKTLFPILPSRNNKIKKANILIKQISNEQQWMILEKDKFYLSYLSILKKVSKIVKKDISTIEMLLFAKAEEISVKLNNENSTKS